jgi:diguanylate cyclase
MRIRSNKAPNNAQFQPALHARACTPPVASVAAFKKLGSWPKTTQPLRLLNRCLVLRFEDRPMHTDTALVPATATTSAHAAAQPIAAAAPLQLAHLDAKVVVVDDESLNCDALTAFLHSCGYQRVASLPSTHLRAARLADEQPDLVLLDLSHPDAEDVLRFMQADRWLRQVPVIVMSGHNDRATRLRALELGAADFLLMPVDPRELDLRLRNTLDAKARRDQLVLTDALTGLPNRESSLQRLDWAVKHAQRRGHVGAILQVGLTRFKKLTDAYGPRVGDELLRAVALRLTLTLRDTDMVAFGLTTQAKPKPSGERRGAREGKGNSAMLLSGGGEEFTVLLPLIERAEHAAVVARRIIDCMAASFTVADHALFVNCRIGIAVFPNDSTDTDTDTVLRHAGVAMRHQADSADSALSEFRFYGEALNARVEQRMSLENELRRALDQGELRIYYQPKINVHNGRLCGAEALVRWQHPTRGLLQPSEFVGAAEEGGLIGQLGSWVLREALRQLADWRAHDWQLPQVAVNVSSLQFHRAGLSTAVRQALADAKLAGSSLCLELTESAIIDSGAHVAQTLQEIKALGVQLALDDFGTGYSSLSHLQRFPIDEIKIDRSFLAECGVAGAATGTTAIATAIIAMGRGLGLRVVAEGVETPAQLNFIRAHGCDAYQGFLHSKPLSAHAFGAMLAAASIANPLQTEPARVTSWSETTSGEDALA